MSRVSVMRLLRLEYGISTRELARAAGVSHQYVSGLELGVYPYSADNTLMRQAFEKIVQERRDTANRLAEAFERNRDRLLEFVER